MNSILEHSEYKSIHRAVLAGRRASSVARTFGVPVAEVNEYIDQVCDDGTPAVEDEPEAEQQAVGEEMDLEGKPMTSTDTDLQTRRAHAQRELAALDAEAQARHAEAASGRMRRDAYAAEMTKLFPDPHGEEARAAFFRQCAVRDAYAQELDELDRFLEKTTRQVATSSVDDYARDLAALDTFLREQRVADDQQLKAHIRADEERYTIEAFADSSWVRTWRKSHPRDCSCRGHRLYRGDVRPGDEE